MNGVDVDALIADDVITPQMKADVEEAIRDYSTPNDFQNGADDFLRKQGYFLGGWIARILKKYEDGLSDTTNSVGSVDTTGSPEGSPASSREDHERSMRAISDGSVDAMIDGIGSSIGRTTQGHSSGIPGTDAKWNGEGLVGGIGEV